MDPISRKKTSVSPFNKVPSSESVPDDTPASPASLEPLARPPQPVTKALSGKTVLAPQPSVSPEDIAALANAIDKRVDALINYLEKWIQVGNLKMTNIKEYIQNYHD